jgi:hypothetical protein
MMKVLPQISGLERVLTILLALVNLASFHQALSSLSYQAELKLASNYYEK